MAAAVLTIRQFSAMLRAMLDESGAVGEASDGAPDVLAPARLGPLRLRNRVIKAATFEGATPKRWSPTSSSTTTCALPRVASP